MCWSLWLAEYKEKSHYLVHTHLSVQADTLTNLDAYVCTQALWVVATARVLEGRHCGWTGLSGSIKWPSHGSPLAWVVWYWCVCVDRDGYTHPAKVR